MTHTLLASLALVLVACAGAAFARSRSYGRFVVPLVMLLAFVSRPDQTEHAAAITDNIYTNPTAYRVTTSLPARAALAARVAARLEYHDCWVFTVTTVRGTVVGVGVFDHVFVRTVRP